MRKWLCSNGANECRELYAISHQHAARRLMGKHAQFLESSNGYHFYNGEFRDSDDHDSWAIRPVPMERLDIINIVVWSVIFTWMSICLFIGYTLAYDRPLFYSTVGTLIKS